MSVDRRALFDSFLHANQLVSGMLGIAPTEVEHFSNPTVPMQATPPYHTKPNGLIQIDINAAFWNAAEFSNMNAVAVLCVGHEFYHVNSAPAVRHLERPADVQSGRALRLTGFVPMEVHAFVSSYQISPVHESAQQRYQDICQGWNEADLSIRCEQLARRRRQESDSLAGAVCVVALAGIAYLVVRALGKQGSK